VLELDSCDSARCCGRYPERNVSNYRVVVGEFDRFQHDSTEQVYDVRQLIVHEKYVGLPTFWDCDIALLEIDGHCPVTMCSLPICLPSNNDTDPLLCFATGWGRDIGACLYVTVKLPLHDTTGCQTGLTTG